MGFGAGAIRRLAAGPGVGPLEGLPGSVNRGAGRREEIPALAEKPGQPFLPVAITCAGSEFLKGGFPRFVSDEGLKGVARGKTQLSGSEVNSDQQVPSA